LSDTIDTLHRPADTVGRFLFALSKVLAVIGGLILTAAGFITIYSIVALQILNTSFPGDVEVISYSLVISSFLFLPYSQMVRGHVTVDLFTSHAPPAVKRVLDAIGAVLFAAMAILVGVRMVTGGIEMYERTQTTALLNIPYWWAFPLAVFCLWVLAAVSLYTAWQSLTEDR
jgi:TRAP-type C4-dicarboxylate transport system permease small subunit